MQGSKTPGPDGFTAEFLKVFSKLISPVLLEAFNEAFAAKTLPPTFYQASISVLLKEGKDPKEPGSYRPISLLNVDTKLLAKMLATRLEGVLPAIISPDQTGFIKNRFLFSNIRRLYNVLYSPGPAPQRPEVLLSLDAEKAFDRVEWDFLFTVLKRFGFGDKFITWVKLLYQCPLASVLTNSFRSHYFPLCRGTRQGCPLSPLLFALSIEPLAIALRSLENYEGIHRGGIENRVSLYADDLLLYVTNPHSSLPNIMSILKEYGEVSGYKLNYSKSELFPINKPAQSLSYSHFPFKITTNSFRHLGVVVTRRIAGLFAANFKPLLERTIHDLERWSHLHITLAGRTNAIKMNVLPKFLFLFQTILIVIRRSFFTTLDKIISSFIWNKKRSRIRNAFLQRPKPDGGMGLPNLQLYYWTCNIRALSFWVQFDKQDENPLWVQMEHSSCGLTSLNALLFSPMPLSLHYVKNNPIVTQSLKIWSGMRKQFGWHSGSLLAPVYPNHLFSPSVMDESFDVWKRNGIFNMKALFIDKTFPTFGQLQRKFNLLQSHLFKFFQIRNYVKTNTLSYPYLSEESTVETLFSFKPSKRGAISFFYPSYH